MVRKFDRVKSMKLAGSMFIVCGLMAAVPLRYVQLHIEKEYLDEFISYPWALGGAIYIIGAIIYMLKIPERFIPRKFDNFVSIYILFKY